MDTRRDLVVRTTYAAVVLLSIVLGLWLLVAGVMDIMARHNAPLAWAQSQCTTLAADASSTVYQACVREAQSRGPLVPGVGELATGFGALALAAALIGGGVLWARWDELSIADHPVFDRVRNSLASLTS